MAIVNAQVSKNNNESDTNLLRRFSRKIKGSGILRAVRGRRYFSREDSKLRRKQGALARMETAKKYERLRKLGKIS